MAHAVSIEPFLQFANLLAEAMLLVSGTGVILAANRGVAKSAGAQPAKAARETAGRRHDRHPRGGGRVSPCLRRTREMMPSAFTLVRSDGTTLACRTEGAVLRPRSEEAEALIVLRLIPKQTESQFAALSQKIAELDREIQQRVRVERELREQREWLGVTLASIGDAVIVTDTSGAVMFMNPIAETLTGWTAGGGAGPAARRGLRLDQRRNAPAGREPGRQGPPRGGIVGLANQSVLIARAGRRSPSTTRPPRSARRRLDPRRRPGLPQHRGAAAAGTRAAPAGRGTGPGRPPEGRVPGHARPRAAQPPGPHRQRRPGAPPGHRASRARPTSTGRSRSSSRQVRHLARLVDDLLDVSRITRGKIELRPRAGRPGRRVVARAVESVRPLIEAGATS